MKKFALFLFAGGLLLQLLGNLESGRFEELNQLLGLPGQDGIIKVGFSLIVMSAVLVALSLLRRNKRRGGDRDNTTSGAGESDSLANQRQKWWGPEYHLGSRGDQDE